MHISAMRNALLSLHEYTITPYATHIATSWNPCITGSVSVTIKRRYLQNVHDAAAAEKCLHGLTMSEAGGRTMFAFTSHSQRSTQGVAQLFPLGVARRAAPVWRQ